MRNVEALDYFLVKLHMIVASVVLSQYNHVLYDRRHIVTIAEHCLATVGYKLTRFVYKTSEIETSFLRPEAVVLYLLFVLYAL